MRVAVFLPNWVGDVVMATPAIRALRKYVGPSGHLVGVMRPYVAEVLAGSSWFEQEIIYEKRASQSELAWPAVRRHLQDLNLDAVILLTNSLRTGWMAWRSGARQRVGYAGRWRDWLLTTRLYDPRRGTRRVGLPPIDSYLNLVYAFGCNWEPPRLELATTADDERRADALWRRLDLPEGRRVVVFNSGGAFGAAKHWPVEHFASLARRIVKEQGLSILVNCGPAERTLARRIVAEVADRRVVSLGDEDDLPIGLAKACIRRSRMLVTTDSGPRFFGIAFGLPVVTLFGPTGAATTRTHYEREKSLSLSLDCQPCMQRVCPLQHHRCMRELSDEMVYQAVKQHLDNETNQCNAA